MAEQRFAFAFDRRFAPLLRGIGIREDNCEVVVDDERFVARYGRFRVRTPLTNVKDVRITRDYRWYRAIGPRGSATDRGATFGTNTEAGVCVCFHEPVRALFPWDIDALRHPGLTVTVADVEGLVAAIRARVPIAGS